MRIRIGFAVCFLGTLLFLSPVLAGDKWNAELPNIVIVSTGGTIAEKTDPKTGGAVPALSGKELIAAVPGLAEIANVSVQQLCNIDSSQMTPEIWGRLSRKVNELLADDKVDGVVVTHGTDTMAEGAYFLDLTTRSDKPVVFTGAMNDASSANPDGPGNIMNAVIQAASVEARNWGVTVTLNRYINSARAVRKTQTINMQTFMSGEKGYLGYISGKKIYRINERVHRQYLPLPKKLPKVVYIATYAGADGSLVLHAVDSGAKGLVVDGVGAGNVNKAVYEAIKYALSRKVAVIISSSVYYGAVEPVYGGPGGGKTLSDDGCILAGNLKGHKARLLLMLGLANYGNDSEKLKELFDN
ncbi:asparaginase [Desulfovibrio sp. JC010]|uniref:asparaginase n=1 Tax=Desulfovibrio sp. JC010 TaxID=2593641 RepID=UPI00193F38E9|nr:asparaginase [Desulfovibrio sp. JC010]